MNRLNENTKFIYCGFDVHKDTNSACCFDPQTQQYFGQTKFKATYRNTINYLQRIKQLYDEEVLIICGYEAGPTGLGLCREIQKAGFSCVVIAPTTIRRDNSKVKTDKRDAKLLAETLAYHTYSPVQLPDEKIEAMKEYTRARNSKKLKLKKAKQELLSFMLRTGKVYPKKQNEGNWTSKHFAWLKGIQYEDPWLQESFEVYLTTVRNLMVEVQFMDERIIQMADDEEINLEDGAAGAAKGAGIGAGIYKDSDAAFATLKHHSTETPDIANKEAYMAAYARWKEILEKQ